MPVAQVFPVQAVFEDSGAYLMARIRGTSGAYISQASLGSPGGINLRVYEESVVPETDAEDDDAVVATRNLTVADCVFDSLQTSDPRWTADTTGYNFLMEILPADLPKGGKTYRFELKFTNASGKVWHVVPAVPSGGLYRS